jgi:hypothetical protein
MAGENLDLSSDDPVDCSSGKGGAGRPFLGIQFACCGLYARIYVNEEGTAYEGRCPRCARAVRVGIAAGGSASRFFTAY